MTFAVEFSPNALRDAAAIDEWWRAHRHGAPALFAEELTLVIALISAAPNAGQVFRHTRGRIVRRVLMRRCGFHVYYEPGSENELVVLAIHGAMRGSGPPL